MLSVQLKYVVQLCELLIIMYRSSNLCLYMINQYRRNFRSCFVDKFVFNCLKFFKICLMQSLPQGCLTIMAKVICFKSTNPNCFSHAQYRQLKVTSGLATLYSGPGVLHSVHCGYQYLHIKVIFMIFSWLRFCVRDGLNSMGWNGICSLLVDLSQLSEYNSLVACADITDQQVGLLTT